MKVKNIGRVFITCGKLNGAMKKRGGKNPWAWGVQGLQNRSEEGKETERKTVFTGDT